MSERNLPRNLEQLNKLEQSLRTEAESIIQGNPKLLLHIDVIERTMSIARALVHCPKEDEDYRVIKMLSIRIFNAFGASLKLLLSGYHQKSAMIMRDVMETMFLMDFFRTDNAAIKRWRCAGDNKSKREFLPVKVREALDTRDGIETSKERMLIKCSVNSHPIRLWERNIC